MSGSINIDMLFQASQMHTHKIRHSATLADPAMMARVLGSSRTQSSQFLVPLLFAFRRQHAAT
jgi:hypothetical protein